MRSFSKLLTMLFVIPLVLAGGASSQQQSVKDTKFPNELPRFKFYQESKWKSLVPLVSTMADVRSVMGKPLEANDLSQFTKPYPGDAAAKEPVFTYNYNNDWQILVYFVKYCFCGAPHLPHALGDRLCSIDLIPKKRMSFEGVKFSTLFKKTHIIAADAAWNEYADGSGLFYEVYTTRTPYGNERPGDLNRISYGPSVGELARYKDNGQPKETPNVDAGNNDVHD
jgi:hypothetical protein